MLVAAYILSPDAGEIGIATLEVLSSDSFSPQTRGRLVVSDSTLAALDILSPDVGEIGAPGATGHKQQILSPDVWERRGGD